MLRILSFGILLLLAACSAPQGKKIAANGGPAPVASGPGSPGAEPAPLTPPVQSASLTYANRGETVNLYANSTITVTLPSHNRSGYGWRFAEIPDPTVLQPVSKEFTPGPTPQSLGAQTLVLQAVGPGEVNVKLWYSTLWASRMEDAQSYEFVAAVSSATPKVESKPKKRAKKN